MINIKSFSPLKDNKLVYYLNDTNFEGTEVFFTHSSSLLYLMVLRLDTENMLEYDIISYDKMIGHYNGVDYDYRIDCSNYIKIIHTDVNLTQNGEVFYMDSFFPICNLTFLMDPANFGADPSFTPYIYTKSNNDQYITGVNAAKSYVNSSLNFIFSDYISYQNNAFWDEKAYKNSHFLVSLQNGTMQYLIVYDKDNNVIKLYNNQISVISDSIRTIFYYLPKNTHRIEGSIVSSGQYIAIRKTVEDLCNRQQYFYFGTEKAIDSVCFTGKREKREEIRRQNISFGKKLRSINIYVKQKYTQNTGFNITENKLFSFSRSPYIFDVSGLTHQEWVLDDTTFEGFNTKKLDGRNIVLNLTKRKSDERYTGFKNDFYS